MKLCRESHHQVKPKTSVVFEPLINEKPGDPSVIFTSMLNAKQKCADAGHSFTVFVADVQLYKIVVEVSWHYHRIFDDKVVIPIGGMHFLMNFIGCIGKLMRNSGQKKFYYPVLAA